jgi:clan AA aspartic protease
VIRGVVNATYEAIVRIRVRGPGQVELDVDAVVDSGFNAIMALPDATIAALGLTLRSLSRTLLADGSVRQFGVYAAEVLWDGVWRPVLVLALGDQVLLGMRLLAGHALRIAVVPGGTVVIVPLP